MNKKYAFVHDWLLVPAGSEKVLESLVELFEGPIYTLLYQQENYGDPIASRAVNPSFLQHLPRVERYYRNLLPLFPFTIRSFDLSAYDLIISSSHCVAKGVKKHPGQMHICYCHTPMRYAWNLSSFYTSTLSWPKRLLSKPLLRYLRSWDKKSAALVDHFVANSRHIQRRIRNHYGRDAEVIYPPVDTHLFSIASDKEDYYVSCSRFVPYKRMDLLVDTFATMPGRKLLLIGDGPDWAKLKKRAQGNVEMVGHLPAEAMREKLSKARAFLFAAEEDFGIAPVEAQAAGVPVIAFGRGGSLETVVPDQTGLFFDTQTVSSLSKAIETFEIIESSFDPKTIRAHALNFSKERFQNHFQAYITSIRNF